MKITNLHFVILTALTMIAAGVAQAADEREEHERFHAAFQDCAAQLGIEAPVKGQRPAKLADDKKAELDSCLERQGVTPPPGPPPGGAEHHAAMRACVEASGVYLPPPPGPGEDRVQLTAEQRAVVEKCHEQVQTAQNQQK